MAKVDDPKTPGRDESPRNFFEVPASTRRRPQHMSLGKLMVWLIGFALLFWAARQVYWSGQAMQLAAAGFGLGVTICSFGIWWAVTRSHFTFVGWIIFLVGFITMSTVTRNVLCLPALPILIGAIGYLCDRRRSNEQDALLGVLALSANRQMPLSPGVLAFSGQSSGVFKLWTETLGEVLRRGIALPEALESLPGMLPRPSRLLIRLGTDSGNLTKGIQEAVRYRDFRNPLYQAVSSQLAYVVWIGFSALGITGFLTFFVLPRFEAIFRDFGIALPEITILVIKWSHLLLDYAWIPILICLSFSLGITINFIQGHGLTLPLLGRLFVRQQTLLILRSIVLFVEAEQPISRAMNLLGQWYPTDWVRRKLAKVSMDVSHGHDWIDSLQSCGLLNSSDVGVLISAQRAGNLAWAIRELVATGERRWSFRILALSQLGFIGSVLILGGFIFVLSFAYFAPLTLLISRLSQ